MNNGYQKYKPMKSQKLKQAIDKLNFERINIYDFINCCPYTTDELRESNRSQYITAWRNLGIFSYAVHLKSVSMACKYLNRNHATGDHALNRLVTINKTDKHQLDAVEALRNYISNNEPITYDNEIKRMSFISSVSRFSFEKNVLTDMDSKVLEGIGLAFDYINKVNE